jgi:hypothetical protein
VCCVLPNPNRFVVCTPRVGVSIAGRRDAFYMCVICMLCVCCVYVVCMLCACCVHVYVCAAHAP